MSEQETSDSEDEICFGKYTMKEAKRDVLKYVPKKINRRQTILSSTISKFQANSTEETFASNHENQNIGNSVSEETVNISDESLSDAVTREDSNISHNLDMSNDEICFGKYTMNEAKRDVLNYVPNKINRRHTILLSSTLNKCQANTTEETIGSNHDIQNIGNSVLEETVNISDEILSKLEDAVTSVTNEDSNVSHNLDMSNESRTDIENQVHNYLHNKSNTKESSFGFETLDLSYSDEKEYSFNIAWENTSFHLSVPQPEPQFKSIPEGIKSAICIKDSANMEQQQETSSVLMPEHFSISKIDKTSEIKTISKLESKRTPTQDIQDSNSSSSLEISEEPSVIGALQTINHSKVYELQAIEAIPELDDTKNLSPSAPVVLSQINLEQFDDSCQFNDSLEDINIFLAQKVNRSFKVGKTEQLSPKVISTSGKVHSNGSGLQNGMTVMNVLSPNTLQKCKTFYSVDKIEKQFVEVKRSIATKKSKYQQPSKIKPPSVSVRSLFPKHTQKVESTFKIPTKLIKKPVTPIKLTNSAFKNVVSPVSVYIKHSPKYIPMVKARPGTNITMKLSQPVLSSVKENIPCVTLNQEFPAVIYKSAKTKIIKDKTDIILPGNIKKLINQQVVTKHNGRTQHNGNKSIERRLIESDLTIDLSHDNQDISVLTNTQPFIIKKS